ncbi:MAG: hypothetical protein OEY99_00925 [Aigarchaeota archaeon]|nr:hypothetical protein [Candidatus Bathyarchaeota archaeon]MDH5702754.1 hypothetical protein [Aigarchaeota archaeon]
MELGWIRKHPGPRAETYQANLENPVVNCILDLLRKVKNSRTVMEVHQRERKRNVKPAATGKYTSCTSAKRRPVAENARDSILMKPGSS